MTAALRQEITAKGMRATLIDNITGYAETFCQANVAQEGLKGSTKSISGDKVDTFNAIYDEIIGICKIASGYFRYESLKKEQFSFSKVTSTMGVAKIAKVTEPAQV